MGPRPFIEEGQPTQPVLPPQAVDPPLSIRNVSSSLSPRDLQLLAAIFRAPSPQGVPRSPRRPAWDLKSVAAIAAAALNDPATRATLRGLAAPAPLEIGEMGHRPAPSIAPPMTARSKWRATMAMAAVGVDSLASPLKVQCRSPRQPEEKIVIPSNVAAARDAEKERLQRRPTAEQRTVVQEHLDTVKNLWIARRSGAPRQAPVFEYRGGGKKDPNGVDPSELSRLTLQVAREQKRASSPYAALFAAGADLGEDLEEEELTKAELQLFARAEARLTSLLKYGARIPRDAMIPETPRPEVRAWNSVQRRADQMLHHTHDRDMHLVAQRAKGAYACLAEHELSKQLVGVRAVMDARDGPPKAPQFVPPRVARSRPATPRAARTALASHGLPQRPHSARN